MEMRAWEGVNKRELNPDSVEDSAEIRKILLSLDHTDTELLKEDLKETGQMYPGVITNDGCVINGNRRMAVIEAYMSYSRVGNGKD